jgi:DNA-binding protein YbaB
MPKRPRDQFDEEIINTSIRLPKSMLNRAKIQAIHDDVTLQSLILAALNAELDRREKAMDRKISKLASNRLAG